MANFKKTYVQERRVINNLHVGTNDPNRTYYTFLSVDGKEIYVEYVGKFRVAAIAEFQEVARLNGAKFNGKLYVLK